MRKSFVILVVISLLVGLLLPGCSSEPKQQNDVPSAPEKQQEVITLKMAHQWPQDPHDYVIAAGIMFCDEVEKRTNGQVKIEIYPAESLVKARDTHTALMNGAVDLAIYPYIYAAGVIPELNLVQFPALYRTHDEYYAFKDSKTMQHLEKLINEQLKFKTLAWIQTSCGLSSTKKAVLAPADVKGLKARVTGKYQEQKFEKMGAGITSMPSSETYTAMQRGMLNIVICSASSQAAYKLYEVADYYTSNEDYSLILGNEPICISLKTWDKLTPAQQQVMLEVSEEVAKFALEGAKAENARVAKLFADNGVEVNKLTEEQFKEFAKMAEETAFAKFKKDLPDAAWLLDAALELYGR